MAIFMDVKGTSQQSFQIQKGGARIKNSAGVMQIRNAGDTDFADMVAKILKASGNSIEINSQAAGAGADWKMALLRPVAGMTAHVNYTLPAAPQAGKVLSTDVNGNLSWVDQTSVSGQAGFAESEQLTAEASKTLIPAGSAGQKILPHSVVGHITEAFDIDPLLTLGDETVADSIIASGDFDLSTMVVGDVISVPFGGKLTADDAMVAAFGAAPTTGKIQWSVVYKYL